MSSLITGYNPDVLSCLANLSNDEVFTPPDVANDILDMLPQELFSDPTTKFLDPACKSGVFLREIAKRLIDGLAEQIPDLQERIDHIFHKQLYGIAITELTSLLSRRSLYCTKYPNSVYSVSKFENQSGNIRFKKIQHRWKDNRCIFCGASQEQYERDATLETHAYEFIHTIKPEDIFEMKFDVIISNPPYQLDTGGSGRQAKPIYNLFIQQALKLNPRYMTMIIPSRWFAGGMGLDAFRNSMMNNTHIRYMVDYTNAKDCFPQNSISGGVCYFLWDRDNTGSCNFVNIIGGSRIEKERWLNEFPVLVRYNDAVEVLRKIASKKEQSLSTLISAISPFGLSTKIRGDSRPSQQNNIRMFSSAGESYIDKSQVLKGFEYIDTYKVMVSQTGAEHAGEPSKDGTYKVLTSSLRTLGPNEICTHSYLIIGPLENSLFGDNVISYLKTKFVRFLILQAMSSIHLTKTTFTFVPVQDFSLSWSDDALFKKYNLSDNEISLIETMIKDME